MSEATNGNRQRAVRGLIKSATPVASASFGLFILDSVTNLIDYGYHFYLGRNLTVGDFAVFQTLNAVLLILVTIFGVLQPLVARYIAGAETGEKRRPADRSRSIFQFYFRFSLVFGVALSFAIWFFRTQIGVLLNVPAAAVGIFSTVILFIFVRPVFAGALQGLQRFLSFGLLRTTFAIGRLATAGILLSLGWGLTGALTSLPVGSFAAVLFGALVLGKSIWKPAEGLPKTEQRSGLKLSAAALIAFSAFILMMNLDLIWVNRSYTPQESGVFATGVLLRRALLLFPGAVSIVVYPRAVVALARGKLPDRTLLAGAIVIAGTTAALSGFFAVAGEPLILLTFGEQYAAASGYLGLLGVAMVGYGLASLWMHFYIASRPLPFVIVLCLGLAAQIVLFVTRAQSIAAIIWVFLGTGWMLAVSGFLLYFFWFRPHFKRTLGGEYDE